MKKIVEDDNMSEDWKNQLYYGDNLKVMRDYISDESVDLIYLDPPFNSKASYNILYKEANGASSEAQIRAFEDTWHWGIEAEEEYHELVTEGPKKLSDLIQSMRMFLGQNDMMAYLTMMAIRLVEMYRILKRTGSIYLHCDPTASHYLKLVMDAVFDTINFRNEIIWCYKRWPSKQDNFQKMHDIILRYSKSKNATWNQLYEAFTEQTQKRIKGGMKIEHIVGESGKILIRATNEKSPGVAMCDYWNIPMIAGQAKERMGYPTQKPEALLERIITASSNEKDIVFDPFCGCGTAITVAEQMGRKWVGIDITHLAITLIKHRLEDNFKSDLAFYKVIGEPTDLHGAEALAEQDKYQFEWWAIGLVDARPANNKKKGADSGIDGYINFFDDNTSKAKTVIISVKGGHVTVSQIRDLKGVLERENAPIGIFITLKNPTRPMLEEAVSAGFYIPEHYQDKHYPKIQIITIEELLNGRQIKYPRMAPATFRKAEKKLKRRSEQTELGFE